MLRSLFIDFNAYFASVEQQADPRLRGRPVGVVQLMTDSTCCIAASYEARAFGVRTGTNVAEARRLCPGIVFVQSRPEVYVDYHQRALAAVERVAPVRQVRSIDEMECELTGSWRQRAKALEIARRIKQSICGELGECLRTSIGIAPNTLLAKLASDMQKPDGLVVLEQRDLPAALLHLPLAAITGIGPGMQARLARCGITTMAQFYAAPRDLLRTVWGGVAGSEMYDQMRGQWMAVRTAKQQSLGHSHVLPPAQRNPEGAYGVLCRLVHKAAMRLRKQDVYATAMAVGVYGERRHHGGEAREARLGETQDTAYLLQVLDALWHTGLSALPAPKFVSIALHGLVPARGHTPSLFDTPAACATAQPPPARDRARLYAAMDALNRVYGKNTLYFASAHEALDAAPMRIAFNRIPDVQTEG